MFNIQAIKKYSHHFFNLVVLLMVFNFVNAQWSPFYLSDFESSCGAIEYKGDDIYFLITINEYPDFFGVNPVGIDEVGGSFTHIKRYSTSGNFISEIQLPDSDSINYYGRFLKILPNNKILVVGENYNFQSQFKSYGIFLAIIDSLLDSVEILYNFPFSTEDTYPDNVLVTDSEILIKNFLKFYVFDINGTFQETINLGSSCTPGSTTITDNAFFRFGERNYLLNRGNLGSTNGLLLKQIEDNSCSLVFSENIGNLLLGNQLGVSTFGNFGKSKNNNYLLYGFYNSNIYPAIYNVDENQSLQIFFIDTSNVNLDFGLSKIDFLENSNNLFISYSPQSGDTLNRVLIYSINMAGNIIWKNSFELNTGLERKGNFPLFASKVLRDNSYIVTYSVKNYKNKSDVYILRVDSNGNVKNFVTSVNSMHSGAINVKVYPNPANDALNFEILSNENFTVELYNLAGQKVKSAKHLHHQTASINIGDFSKGMYFYQIKSESGSLLKSGKFLKE